VTAAKKAIIASAIAMLLGVSFFLELQKHRFEWAAVGLPQHTPGMRVLSSTKSRSLISPVSWFWPARTNFTFAVPDDKVQNRFYVAFLNYGEEFADFYVDANCDLRDGAWYGLGAAATAVPARDFFGKPIVARNGETFRRIDHELPFPRDLARAFCDTDWTKELEALTRRPQIVIPPNLLQHPTSR